MRAYHIFVHIYHEQHFVILLLKFFAFQKKVYRGKIFIKYFCNNLQNCIVIVFTT
jgi:hypothetical protein